MSQRRRRAYLAELHRGVLDKRHPLEGDCVVIGRDLDADIRVDDSSVSRQHAAVERRGDGFVVRDLGSRNGTQVNEHHLRDGAERALQPNDCIFVGKAVLCLVLAEERLDLSDESERDPLTGVANRRALLELLAESMAHARATRKPLAVWLVGVEDLAGINQRHGQAAGDVVLRHVARVLKHALEPGEKLARWRGAVFAMVSPGAVEEPLAERAERLRARIEDQPVVHGDELILVGVSIGMAAMSSAARDRLLEAADEALSRAKLRGHCVEQAGDSHLELTTLVDRSEPNESIN